MFESSPRESVGFWGSFQGPAAEGATGPRKRSGTQDRDREQDLWKAGASSAVFGAPHRRSKGLGGIARGLNLSGTRTEGGRIRRQSGRRATRYPEAPWPNPS